MSATVAFGTFAPRRCTISTKNLVEKYEYTLASFNDMRGIAVTQERKKSMTIRKALNGKPYAGSPHVRFDACDVAPSEKPRCGALLYKKIGIVVLFAGVAACSAAGVPCGNVTLREVVRGHAGACL